MRGLVVIGLLGHNAAGWSPRTPENRATPLSARRGLVTYHIEAWPVLLE